jgi:hypothetical protein
MNVLEWKKLLDFILKNFTIRYEDFREALYGPYEKRRIVGFVRFDQKEVFFDKRISGKVEELTWAHEVLSIHYYHILKVIKHDEEIENEAIMLCNNPVHSEILRAYINKTRSSILGTQF